MIRCAVQVAVQFFLACLCKTTKWALCPISRCHFAGQVSNFFLNWTLYTCFCWPLVGWPLHSNPETTRSLTLLGMLNKGQSTSMNSFRRRPVRVSCPLVGSYGTTRRGSYQQFHWPLQPASAFSFCVLCLSTKWSYLLAFEAKCG